MTLIEIQNAVNNNQNVHWVNSGYKVSKDERDQFHVVCLSNESAVGLTDINGVLQGKEADFFIK